MFFYHREKSGSMSGVAEWAKSAAQCCFFTSVKNREVCRE